MDIDLHDLDGPSKPPPTKPSKFAPKNSKFKPVPKPKPEPSSSVIPKIETEDDSNHKPIDDENEQISINNNNGDEVGNGGVKIDNGVEDMEVDGNGEDEIVREIDVFFNSPADANLQVYVLQYPLRPNWRPYELEERCEEVRLKQETSDVEVQMSVQFDSENYDDVDGDKALPKQVVSSAWHPLTATAYAVGILTRNELHLNPVHTVVPLRPSMQHVPEDPLKKTSTTGDEDEQAIKQKSKKQSKLPGSVKEQKADDKEQWIPLKYYGETSQLSHGYMENLVAQQTSQLQFSMTQSDYIDSFCPATSDKPKPKGPSRSSLLKLPLEERFKLQLLEGPPVHRFKALKHIAPDHSDSDVLKVLQSHAQLVQGLWIATSKLKYGTVGGKDALSRNYVLLQFSKSPIFHEKQLHRSPMISETMKGILDEFAARRDTCRDWKFKESPDDSFIREYGDIVKEQKKNWDDLEPHIMELLYPPKILKPTKAPISSTTSDAAPKITKAGPPKPVMTDETKEALPKALHKLFQTYKVCSLTQIRQRLRDMAVSENTQRKESREAKAAAAAAEASPDELMKILNKDAVNIHGVYVPISSPDHSQYDDLRKVVIDLFLAEGPEGKLKKASIYAAAELQLKKKITSVEYQKVLSELCISKHSAWVLKSGDSPT